MAAPRVAGNTVVFKPSPEAVLVGQKIDELFRLAGFPEGVVNRVFVTVERAAKGVIWGTLFTSGQVGASAQRVYVERPIAEAFIEACVDEVKRLRVGDPLNENIDLGPLTTKRQLEIIISHIDDAVSKGAKIVTGGHF